MRVMDATATISAQRVVPACKLGSYRAGSFTMGSSADEVGHQSNESQREVTLTRRYYMMAHEVTQHAMGRTHGVIPCSAWQ